ncbi:MAG: PTS N-acetylglucosamine IIC subunit, partial [Mycoplasma sp.]|nr:PTS N-acetylglucosamine IIC subunit [Mycoplasma sp.]
FFPTFLGAIPATGFAIIFTAKKENRKQIIALIGGAGLVSLLTGIDEPIVFIWIFLSPLLLIIHAILAAIFGFVVTIMGIRIGFGFSAGLIDYIISFHKSWMFAKKSDIPFLANPLMIWPISLIMGTIYFVIWSYIIKKLDLQTPGREKEQVVLEKQSNKTTNINKYEQMANRLVEIIGVKNFVTIENCASRLRLVLKSNDVDENQLKALGIFKVIKIGDKQLQLIIGTDVE